MPATYVCVPCATGTCDQCRGVVVTPGWGSTSKRCVCRHGATSVVGRPTDPRRLGGTITGGTPTGSADALIDASRAVIVDDLHVVRIDNPSDGREVLGVLISGRINRTDERAAVLNIIAADGAAAFVSELLGLAARMGPEFELEFRSALTDRLAAAEIWPSTGPGGDGS